MASPAWGGRPNDPTKPIIENPDGTFSTEKTITIEADGRHYVMPTIVNGREYTPDEAIDLWRQGKNPEVGVFRSASEADAYARQRHNVEERTRERDRVQPARRQGMEWTEDYTPSALDQIRSAQDADEKERRRREALAEIQQGIDMVVRRRTDVPRPQAQPFDKNLQAFLLSRKVGQEDQAAELARAKLEHETQGDLSGQPAPPEWGAIPGMTRKEALGAGYGKAPKPPDENEDELAPPEWHERLRGLGIPNPGGVSRKFAERLLLADVGRQGQVQATIAGEERKTEREAPEKARDSAMKLRQEFQGQQTYKDMQAVAAAYEKIDQAAPTGAGDMALLFGYMKLLDPGSTVREGEFQSAAESGSLPQRVQGWATKVLSGERLPENVRQQFKTEALGVLQAQKRRYDTEATKYRDLASKFGIDPGLVVGEIGVVEARVFKNGRVYEKRGGKWFDLGPEVK